MKLEPKVMQMPNCLAERQGGALARDELVAAAWSDTIEALNRPST